MKIRPELKQLIKEIVEKEQTCPNLNLNQDIINTVNKFNASENFLRAGGLSVEQLDKLAFGFYSDEVTQLEPKQLSIKWKDDLDNVKYEVSKSGLSAKNWSQKVNLEEPIDVSYENGRFFIEDGHHRYFAAKTLGRILNVNLEIKDSPVKKLAPKLGYDNLM